MLRSDQHGHDLVRSGRRKVKVSYGGEATTMADTRLVRGCYELDGSGGYHIGGWRWLEHGELQ